MISSLSLPILVFLSMVAIVLVKVIFPEQVNYLLTGVSRTVNQDNLIDVQTESVLNRIPTAVVVIDKDLSIIYTNEKFSEISNLSENELIGNTFDAFVENPEVLVDSMNKVESEFRESKEVTDRSCTLDMDSSFGEDNELRVRISLLSEGRECVFPCIVS